MLRWALSLELIDRDPTAAIRAPRVPRRKTVILTPAEFNALLEACEGDLRVLVAVAGMAGLREGEVVALRWMDIDFRHEAILVRRNYWPGHGFTDLKTARSRRRVPMIEPLRAILEDYHEERGRPGPEELLFSNAAGKPWDRAKFYPLFQEALRRAGLPAITFHDLRHFFASLAIAGGMSPRALMEAMGHSSIQVTMDLYAVLFPGAHKEAARRMGDILWAAERVTFLRRPEVRREEKEAPR